MFILNHYKKISHYCEIIINHGVLIFADFVVHLNKRNFFQQLYTKASYPLHPIFLRLSSARTQRLKKSTINEIQLLWK
jgi:hypothetical protein